MFLPKRKHQKKKTIKDRNNIENLSFNRKPPEKQGHHRHSLRDLFARVVAQQSRGHLVRGENRIEVVLEEVQGTEKDGFSKIFLVFSNVFLGVSKVFLGFSRFF